MFYYYLSAVLHILSIIKVCNILMYIHVCTLSSPQSCLALGHPIDCRSPGSSVHGILQARILVGVVMPSSMGSSGLRSQTRNSYVSCIGSWVLYH